MQLWKDKKGITLAEVLIAISIFAVISVVSSSILLEVIKMEKRSTIQNSIYEDAQIILQMLTNEIQSGTIDYEEYYSINVAQYARGDSETYYGINYGAYASRFYDPGLTLRTVPPSIANPSDLGTECSFPLQDPPLPANDDTCVVQYKPARDRNTGENPFENNVLGDYTQANAFCDGNGTRGKCGAGGQPINHVDELYLIDSSGTRKTMIVRRRGIESSDWVLGLMRMDGFDYDQNGIIDTFSCQEEFNCFDTESTLYSRLSDYDFLDVAGDVTDFGIQVPQKSDLTGFSFPADNVQFVGISPLRSSIEELTFIINPIEDPYKAYGEPEFQSQPTVTIVMTLGLSEQTELDYPGDFEPITVQTTVAAGVVGKIDSYPPTGNLEWLKNLGLYNWPL